MSNTKEIIQLQTEDGQVFEIPAKGSLGLLALGYKGVTLWRQKRAELRKTSNGKFSSTKID